MENEIKKLTLEELGYDPFFESSRMKFKSDGLAVARVISEMKGAYKAKNTDGEYTAKITGKIRHNARSKEDFPAVGDWVAITKSGEGQAVIRGILPRRSVMKRKTGDKDKKGKKSETQILAANIDTAYIVQSVGRDFSLNRYERYFSIAKNGGIEPAVILNKADLVSREELDLKLTKIKERLGDVLIFATSVETGEGLEKLKDNIVRGKTYCFLGSSGVGKSSLINFLIGDGMIETGDIGEYAERGRHVTTSRQMYFLPNGGIVIDNPGVREIGLADGLPEGDGVFQDIAILAKECKFIDCTHTHEPGCGVLLAVKSGILDRGQLVNYVALKKEAEHNESGKLEKRNKDRQFGKFVNKAKKELRNVGHKEY